MAYKKRSTRSKRSYTRRYKKRSFKPRIPRRRPSAIHNFKRIATLSSIAVVDGTVATKSYNFALNQLPNYTNFSQLFDQYRIAAVKVTFFPNQTTDSDVVAPGLLQIYTCIDLDSNTAPSDTGVIGQYATVRSTLFNRPHVRYLKPRVQNALYYDGSTFGYCVAPGKPWLDSSNEGIPYYGLKCILTNQVLANIKAQQVRVIGLFYIQCRWSI
jgi:hypothetical protein